MIAAHYGIGLALAAMLAGPAGAGILSGGTTRCVPLRAIKAETAETESSLIVHTYDGRAYRNALPAPCDGLLGVNDLGKLGLRGQNGLLCAGDMVWLERAGILSSLGAERDAGDAGCKLGSFEPISEMSLTEAVRR